MIAALLTAATIASPIQYWTPAGTNSWVGDVTVVNFKDRLHVFYPRQPLAIATLAA